MQNRLLYLAVFLSFAACSTSTDTDDVVTEQLAGKGGRVYGGTLRVNETEPLQTLYPPAMVDIVSSQVGSQIYEGLVKFDTRDLSIVPGIAERWEMDSTATSYTFYLKKGVFFHDDPAFDGGKGREVKAQDIKYSFSLLSTPGSNNLAFNTTFKDNLKGANDFYEAGGKGDLEGIKIIDDYTVQLLLERPNSTLLQVLTQPKTAIIPREGVERYGNNLKIGTGPFRYTNSKNGEKVVLVKNHAYHGIDSLGNQLPFLDSVVFTFIGTKKSELEAFQAGKLDLISGLPAESIKEVVEKQIADFQNKPPKYILDRSPELVTQFYEFNTTLDIFKNKKVRQAISYAIDRQRITEQVLKGEAYGPGIYGITPPTIKDYDISTIKGYTYDPEKARKLLAEAGYPNGKNFPEITLTLNSGGFRHTNVALEVQKQLRNTLNINLDMNVVPFAEKLEEAKYARAELTRSAWLADYPNPENFLQLLYGKNVPETTDEPSFPNVTRYKNREFDRLYELGLRARDNKEKYAYFKQAEQLAMNDAPLVVLWYDEKYRLYQATLHNFYPNPVNYWNFAEVYKKAPVAAPEVKK